MHYDSTSNLWTHCPEQLLTGYEMHDTEWFDLQDYLNSDRKHNNNMHCTGHARQIVLEFQSPGVVYWNEYGETNK